MFSRAILHDRICKNIFRGEGHPLEVFRVESSQ